MFDTSRYTIGWVCAIQTELVAARLLLDEEHDHAEYDAALNDNNAYSFGRIGRHNVVIAALPSGEYGTNSAASVARDLVRSFTNVRIALMVGIGGGAPLVEPGEKKMQDIRLGDVVVSTPGDGKGGVWQYDFGKAIQSRKFKTTSHLNQPPASLLTAVTTLGADIEIDGHNIDEEVSENLAKRPKKLRGRYQRPEATTDRLYKSSYIHSDNEQSCSTLCNDEEEIVLRPARDEAEEDVTIHHGLIASGNSLMKDAVLRNSFARKMGILCFEMEAAGLVNQFPFLVIRGICDYSDTHKNKEWQGYAAMTAAAYAKKLLTRLHPAQVESEAKLSELKEIRQSLEQGK